MSIYRVCSGPYFPLFKLNRKIYEIFVFSPNIGKCVPEKLLYLDAFHVVLVRSTCFKLTEIILKQSSLILFCFFIIFEQAFVFKGYYFLIGGAADRSGVSVGDRVVEVNGNNVESFSHSEVVAAIRSNPNETALLVVDKVTDNYLKRIGRPVTSDLLKYKSVFEMENQNLEEETKEQVKNDEEGRKEEEKEDKVKEDTSAPLSNSQESDTLPEKISQLEVESEKVIDNAEEKLDTTSEKSASIKDEDSVSNTSNTESSATSTIPVSEKIQRDPSYEIITSVPEQEKPPEIPPESKPPTISDMKPSKSIPKRKQVKELKTDWKAKQDLFNNL